MKKNRIMAIVLGAAFVLTACSSSKVQEAASQAQNAVSQAQDAASGAVSTVKDVIANGVDAEAIYQTVSSAISLPDMTKIDPEFNYGISTNLCTSYVFYRTKEVTEADTIALFLVKDAADVDTIKQELETAKSFDVDSADGYNPDTFELFSASEIKSAGNLVYWIVSPEVAKIESLIKGAQ